ncbi:MAG TPA: c-type cytochrome [Nitrospirales bacterium]|nr:c-type cytochrome [Nitrospirales bacterium]
MPKLMWPVVIGVVCAVVTWVVSGMLHFPRVFQWMFMCYVALGTGVFLLLAAPNLPSFRGGKAIVGLVVFYLVTSGVFLAGGAILPQYDPTVEQEKINKILKHRRAQFERPHNTEELRKKAEVLSAKANDLMGRVAKLQGAVVPVVASSTLTLSPVQRGEEVYQLYECYNCHKIGGKGGTKKRGPELGNLGNILTQNQIITKVTSTKRDPYFYAEGFEKEHKKGLMPDKYRELMTDEELETLAAYLMTLKNPAFKTPKPIFLKDEVQHGFMVYGYVRDANGQPVPNMKVAARPAKDGSHATLATTNQAGYYEAFMHLHNADDETTIVVSAGDKMKEFTATFDPSDKTTKRQAAMDFTL